MEPLTSKHIPATKIWRVAVSNGFEEENVQFIVAHSAEAALLAYTDAHDVHPLLPLDVRFVPKKEYDQFIKEREL